MKPTIFPESNKVYTAPDGMENCQDLHVWQKEKEPQIISCWQLSDIERLKLLFHNRLYLSVYMQTPPPVWIHIDNPFIDPETDKPIEQPIEILVDKFIERKVVQFLSKQKGLQAMHPHEQLRNFLYFAFGLAPDAKPLSDD